MRIHTHTVIDIETGKVLRDDFYEYDGPLALADRSIQGAAQNNAKTAGTTAAGYGTSALGLAGTLTPALTNDVNNPIGFTPTETNNMLVAGEQGAGGATAGVTGQAGLNAMRTRNTGALSGVLDQAARTKQQQLSENALNVQNQSARLAQQKRASALGGLQGLYGTDVNAQLKAMGIQDQDLQTAIQAGNSGWLQNTMGVIGGLASDASKGAGIAGGYAG
jgi:hypothetical protein